MRSVMITGGTGEIGQAIIKKFNHGHNLVIPSRKEMNLEDMDAIDDYLDSLDKKIDVFIHCAGINEPKPVESILLADLKKTLDINAFSFYKIISNLISKGNLNRNGYILGISSIYGSVSRKNRFSYASSKHCLNGMIKTLAIELGIFNVKVNALSPGFVDTKLTRNNNSVDKIKSFNEKIPLGRLAQANDIAEVAYFMCSLKNSYITGQQIIVDGGYTAGGFER